MTKIPHLYFDGERAHEMPAISQEEAMARMMRAIAGGAKIGMSRSLSKKSEVPKVLDAIADTVLKYRPKPQSKPAKKRQRRRRKNAKSSGG